MYFFCVHIGYVVTFSLTLLHYCSRIIILKEFFELGVYYVLNTDVLFDQLRSEISEHRNNSWFNIEKLFRLPPVSKYRSIKNRRTHGVQFAFGKKESVFAFG